MSAVAYALLTVASLFMLALLEAFVQIALRRLGPEDLPDSRFLLGMALAGYLLAQLPAGTLLYGWSGAVLRVIAADVLLLAGFYWLLLWLMGRANRYRQTLTALLGTGALLTLAQWPLAWWWKQGAVGAEPAVGATVGLLAVVVWSLIVQAHIVTRALSSPFGAGLMVAVAYFLLNYQISGHLAPAPR
jgi:hypothetical protein